MNIVTAIKNGDHLVFQQVFNQYHEKLYFFVLNKTKSKYLAEEVVQLAFIKLWNYKHTLKEEFTISTQIFRIATTTLIDLLRKQHNNLVLIREIASLQQNNSVASFNNIMEEEELLQKITRIINDMPIIQRRVFEMSRIEGKSYKQIAESLSISVRTVEVHISRALKRIKKLLPLFIFLSTSLLFYFAKSKG